MKVQSQTNLKKLNALLVQNNPKLLKKKQNIEWCRKLLENPKEWQCFDEINDINQIDLIAFPQLAFTGYNFANQKHIQQMACLVNQGQDFQFARWISKKFNAYVIFGYVQKTLNGNIEQDSKKDTNKLSDYYSKYNLYNSAAVLDRQGYLILNTRKTHLYFCDELWSKQGDGFKTFDLINKAGQSIKCAVGICMDINEKNFISGKKELADFIIQSKSECLMFISNWTDQSPKTNLKRELIWMLNYWLKRLDPLLQKKQPQRLFLICDRIGSQYNFYSASQSAFFGCSGGLDLNPIKIYKVMDKKQQGCIFIKGRIPIAQNQ